MKPLITLLSLVAVTSLPAADEGITWLVNYEAKALPGPEWTAVGTPKATVENGVLNLLDDSNEFGSYRTNWKLENPDDEIIVEARLKSGKMTGNRKDKSAGALWPWRDGSPLMVQVGDGRHQEGLAIFPTYATNFTDRFTLLDTGKDFHTYRLIIQGKNMSIWVDGEKRIEGQGAFWKPSEGEPFLQFGSTAKIPTAESYWTNVRLGVRKAKAAPAPDPVKITVSPSWDIPREDVRQTRPYLYDMGQGLLLMSVAQGPDAFYEPYGLLKSTDAGQTWAPIPGLDNVDTTPLPVLRRPDGQIWGMSRWTRTQEDGTVVGKTVYLNPTATEFTMVDNKIVLPQEFTNESPGDQIVCERHIWNEEDGAATMVVWSRKRVKLANGRNDLARRSHLVRSTDKGLTWNYVSTIGPGGEPAVVKLNATEMTAVIRGDKDPKMKQMFSSDAGKTWTAPIPMEEGKVLPDLVLMSNGILACSYGRPASCIMFSLDGGKTWPSHHVISERVGFNYTSIREISPGRLLYVHDAPKMNALTIDVERAK